MIASLTHSHSKFPSYDFCKWSELAIKVSKFHLIKTNHRSQPSGHIGSGETVVAEANHEIMVSNSSLCRSWFCDRRPHTWPQPNSPRQCTAKPGARREDPQNVTSAHVPHLMDLQRECIISNFMAHPDASDSFS